ncbi:hypothetical protein COCHEDRAFT_1025201 [Bipolaris maydis C5]|uniref:Uncharacterized protein n=1 Tax=Cochliobolus heterostrophus (strain C5 / ATCC 48332 / race O) TaxID=701091 RepID=M2USW3_COCH5|nr:hypothetical protein COCHEDRAFT_1025201 [Bipolaris maydis C5]
MTDKFKKQVAPRKKGVNMVRTSFVRPTFPFFGIYNSNVLAIELQGPLDRQADAINLVNISGFDGKNSTAQQEQDATDGDYPDINGGVGGERRIRIPSCTTPVTIEHVEPRGKSMPVYQETSPSRQATTTSMHGNARRRRVMRSIPLGAWP